MNNEIVITGSRQSSGISKRTGVFLAAVSLLTVGSVANAATYKGIAVHIGKGTARVVVRTDAANKPSSVSVLMTSGVLKGLPTGHNKKTAEGNWVYPLPMPKHGPNTGFTHVVIDWDPHGHPPAHIYTVPHFDIHFYGIAPAIVEKISFDGPTDPAIKVSDAGLLPPDYKVLPETAVNQMGVHAVDTTSPEFHGKPFTATFIYGYYKGTLIFVEPMVAAAYLETKPHFTAPLKKPAHYSYSGYYPTEYSVRYDSSSKAYVLALEGLQYAGAK